MINTDIARQLLANSLEEESQYKEFLTDANLEILADEVKVLINGFLRKGIPILDSKKIEEIVEINPLLTDLSRERIISMIADSGSIISGHFELLSTKHSSKFMRFSRIGKNDVYREAMAKEIIERFKDQRIDAVIGPTTAGSYLVNKVAAILGIRSIYVLVDNKGRPNCLREGFEIYRGEKLLIVNDLLTTGEGINNIKELIKKNKARIVGMGFFATRDKDVVENLRKSVTKNIHVLVNLNIENVDKAECELCKKGLPYEFAKNLNL